MKLRQTSTIGVEGTSIKYHEETNSWDIAYEDVNGTYLTTVHLSDAAARRFLFLLEHAVTHEPPPRLGLYDPDRHRLVLIDEEGARDQTGTGT